MPRIVCISDTHNRCEGLLMPEGDILVHAGDLTSRGSMAEIDRAAKWLQSMPYEHKVVIAGNHDFCFQTRPELTRPLMDKYGLIYLQDEDLELDGLRFYGSPWQPWFGGWAFNLQRGKELAAKWSRIPDTTDVLITHGPPHGKLDTVPGGEKVGCRELQKALLRVKPKLHVFGHIHEGYGKAKLGCTQLVNASLCDGRYRPSNRPFVVDLAT